MRPFYEVHKFKQVAERFTCDFEYLNPTTISLFKEKYEAFITFNHEKEKTTNDIHAPIAALRETSQSPDEFIREMYDLEYTSNASHYAFLNALLTPEGLEKITGYEVEKLRELQILDVGTGSAELIEFLLSQGVPSVNIAATDVSQASINILQRLGMHGYQGRLEQLALPSQSIDLLFLSYFVDYDTNQKETFGAAIKLTRPGGRIVFEGLLPCIPGGGQTQSDHPERRITEGKSAAEDAELLCQALIDQSTELQRQTNIERIILSYRYIYNQYGLNKRKSIFIVARVT